ncbi:hypothetical protein CVIRNUC_008617 [Coccomyxa viridis]|uniref:Uncharacterized protein n=1 Tax=Coccomyxa viridis TaxID=1274662 RepID=A0AAV1IDR6_9CHLO|nr:hypothetical protein CVIRNUC_008617 [Coccomyxa viridis]
MSSSLPCRDTSVGSVRKHSNETAHDARQLSASKVSETRNEVPAECGRMNGALDSTSSYGVRPFVAPQISVTSHGTFWGTERLPCTSGATVSIGLDDRAAATVEIRRKRAFMHTSTNNRASQGLQETSVQESSYTDVHEQEYESKLVSPTAPHPGSIATTRVTKARQGRLPVGVCEDQIPSWPADRDSAAKAALAEASGDNVEAYWSDYFPPQHDNPEDLDPEE